MPHLDGARRGDWLSENLNDEGRRVLVTGGSGFIGTNVVEAFVASGSQVLNLDIEPPLKRDHIPYWRRVDILARAALRDAVVSFRPDLVIHLAARADLHEKRNLAGYAANIQGVSNLIDAVVAVGSVERTFFVSSRLVCDLGYQPKHDRDYKASTMYGLSKARGEELVREAPASLGTWAILRPTGIWGPWFGTPYRDFFRTIARGLYVHPGRRDVLKAYGYVGNSVHQIRMLSSAPPQAVHGRTFWVADPPIRIREWAECIRSALGAPPIRSVPVPVLRAGGIVGDVIERIRGYAPLTSFRVTNMASDMLYDTSALDDIVGPLPFNLDQGVRMTVEWLNSHETTSRSRRGAF